VIKCLGKGNNLVDKGCTDKCGKIPGPGSGGRYKIDLEFFRYLFQGFFARLKRPPHVANVTTAYNRVLFIHDYDIYAYRADIESYSVHWDTSIVVNL